MNKIGVWTEKVHIIKQNLKTIDMVDINGEVIELHDRTKEILAMEIVNYNEQLSNLGKGSKEGAKIKKSMDEFKQAIDSNCGSFYFMFYNRLLSIGLEPQYIFRFLYLCTYSDYENRLITKRNGVNILVKENDFQDILNLGRTEAYKTKNKLLQKELISIDEHDIIKINNRYCRKGNIRKNKRVGKIRMFDDAIKEIYENSTAKEHKKLALLVAMLPYCNNKYNMICNNPHEEVIDCIEPYSLKELCGLLGQTNITRFKNDLLNLTVNGESVVAFHETKQAKIITINPKVYYAGTKIEDLKWLIDMFSVNK